MDIDKEIAKLLDELGRILQQQRPAQEFSNLTVLNVQILTFLVFVESPPKMREIAEAVGLSLPSASSIIDRLEETGLVKRSHDKDDRRVVLVNLTKKGRGIIQTHINQTATGIKKGLSGFNDKDKQIVLNFFKAYTSAMKETDFSSHDLNVKLDT